MTIPKTLESLSPWLEDAWLERYLNRETTAEETAWFEAYMLEHPHVADALETDAAIATALSLQTPQSVQLRVAVNREVPAKPARPGLRKPSGWLSVAAAAAFTLILTTPFLLRSTDDPSGEQPSRVVLDVSRAAGATALTVLDDRGGNWTMLEVNTPSPRANYEVRIDDKPLGTYKSDIEGVLSVLVRSTPADLQSKRITAIKLADLDVLPVEVNRTVNLDAPASAATAAKVCRGAHQLRSTQDASEFVTVGGRYKDYIDILGVRPDTTPGNPCASERLGWNDSQFVFICKQGAGAKAKLYAHLRDDNKTDFDCASGRPVTLTESGGQYSSAYWDDFDRGFRYYVFLEWDTSRCPEAGCQPVFLESFDLNNLAGNACFNHQGMVDIPTAQSCTALPASKQSDTGNGYIPPK